MHMHMHMHTHIHKHMHMHVHMHMQRHMHRRTSARLLKNAFLIFFVSSNNLIEPILLSPAVRQTPVCTAMPPSATVCAAAAQHIRTIVETGPPDQGRRLFIRLAPPNKRLYNAYFTCTIMRLGSLATDTLWGQSYTHRARQRLGTLWRAMGLVVVSSPRT
jgi:hypothetical protein